MYFFAHMRANQNQPMDWPPFMRILINRILDAGYVEIVSPEGSVFISGMRVDPEHLYITNEGRKFIENIGLREM